MPAFINRLVMGAAIAALSLSALATPARASQPYNHLLASVSGVGAATMALRYTRLGDLDRYESYSVMFGSNRVHNQAERPERRESACITIDTIHLLADGSSEEYVGVRTEVGCIEGDRLVDLDTRELTFARLPSIDITVELQYCSTSPDWATLCDQVPSSREVTVAAELVGISELVEDRGAVRYAPTPECTEVDVYATAWRDGDGTLEIDGATVRADPWLTFIFDGELRFNLICRESTDR
jgi:hypothetical protein